jgi:hypothetical protein
MHPKNKRKSKEVHPLDFAGAKSEKRGPLQGAEATSKATSKACWKSPIAQGPYSYLEYFQ